MKLARFDLYRYSLPFYRPLTLGSITLFQREGILLRLSGDDGSEGWGETSPLPGFSVESQGEAASQLRRLAASMIGREVNEDWVDPYGEFGRELDRVAPSVRFGFELAAWNLYGDSSGRTLRELVAPASRSVVPVNGLLAGSPAEVLEETRRMRDAGYGSIKLKVGTRTVAEDVDLFRALGEELGEDISLRLDANRAWDYEEAAEFVGGTAGVRFEYVEEPLADPWRLPELVGEFGVPVALDESLVGMEPEKVEEHLRGGLRAQADAARRHLADAADRGVGAPPRRDAGRQFGLREWRRDGGAGGAGGRHRRQPCTCRAGHLPGDGRRRSRDAAEPAGT